MKKVGPNKLVVRKWKGEEEKFPYIATVQGYQENFIPRPILKLF